MTSVWAELKRRNVVRVAVAYAVVGWLLIEIASTVLPTFETPQWVLQTTTFIIILGFPLALVLSWVFDLTPQGLERTDKEHIPGSPGRKLDFAIIGALVLALGFVVLDNYVLDSDPSGVAVLPNSVAVLPFENLSPNPDNAYFAAGIHEAILNELVKIRSMNVIARTSMLQYADRATPIAQIARELNVETVMEGSVQYADDRVLVTAQLIDPQTNSHLWSETYNREFADVFAIQADIAMNIANILEAEFSLEEQESLEKIPTQSSAAYALYLQALSASTAASYFAYINQAIERDPGFALAYAHRAVLNTYNLVGVGQGLPPAEALELERSVSEDAERALSIDPLLGLAHAALAVVHQANWRGTAAELAFQRAYELSPNDATLLVQYGVFKRYRGERDEAIRLNRWAVELDPNSWLPRFQLGLTYAAFEDWDTAATTLRDVLTRYPADVRSNAHLGLVEAIRGNAAEAVSLLQRAEQLDPPLFYFVRIAQAYALAGRSEEATRIFMEFERRAATEGIGDAWWATAYVAVGNDEQAMERLQSAVNGRSPVDQLPLINLASNTTGDPELDKPEFRALLDGLWDNE